jgi:hypothetical protein
LPGYKIEIRYGPEPNEEAVKISKLGGIAIATSPDWICNAAAIGSKADDYRATGTLPCAVLGEFEAGNEGRAAAVNQLVRTQCRNSSIEQELREKHAIREAQMGDACSSEGGDFGGRKRRGKDYAIAA